MVERWRWWGGKKSKGRMCHGRPLQGGDVYVETQRLKISIDPDTENSNGAAISGKGLVLRNRKTKGRML